MKNFLIIFFIAISTIAIGQSVKIKWEDQSGREFSITAPSGEFSYGMIAGDYINYDLNGNVSKIGSVYITYGMNGHINKVGSVYISHDINGRVNKVGKLYINYDINGRVTGTTGSVL